MKGEEIAGQARDEGVRDGGSLPRRAGRKGQRGSWAMSRGKVQGERCGGWGPLVRDGHKTRKET